MIDWLRRRICRCPEPEPMLQVTGGFVPPYGTSTAVEWPYPEPPVERPRHLHAVPDETE
jgi:hypothetical protein